MLFIYDAFFTVALWIRSKVLSMAPQTCIVMATDYLLNCNSYLWPSNTSLPRYLELLVLPLATTFFSNLLLFGFGGPKSCKAFSLISLTNSYAFSRTQLLFQRNFLNLLSPLKPHLRFLFLLYAPCSFNYHLLHHKLLVGKNCTFYLSICNA